MYVYFIRAGNRGAIKIGIAKNIERRMATMQTGNAFQLHLLARIPCDNKEQALFLESKIHNFFKRQKIRGEWFQGNIDFRKIGNVEDFDKTKSSPNYSKSDYVHSKDAKKKRRAKLLKQSM